MIEVPTVLVLGAGASKPYGFPTGRELVEIVLGQLDETYAHGSGGGTDFERLLNLAPFDRALVEEFRDSLRHARSSSIDRFLELRTEFRPLGKFLIAATLVPCQRASDELFPEECDWIPYLLEHFPMNEPAPGLLSVVTFNYDTSFETILRAALQHSYPEGDPRRTKVVAEIETIHLHGTIGDLWSPIAREAKGVRPRDLDRIRVAADGIQIVNELDDDDLPPEFQEAQALLQRAEAVCFLGLGYLPENLRRLGFSPHRDLPSETHYYCCTHGLRSAEIDRAARNLGPIPEFFVEDGEFTVRSPNIMGEHPNVTMGSPENDALMFLREYPVLG